MTDKLLQEYYAKRDLSRTPEPGDEERRPPWGESGLMFVVQKHDASRLHYDFRLEAEGVLKSWAVPKGPSTNPSVKRLAIHVEDHPIGYVDFEGVIPQGEYGGGTVMVWDAGTYTLPDGNEGGISTDIGSGHLVVELHGEKLRGGFALTRTGSDADARWLLVKMRDEYADDDSDILRDQPYSALTGRSLDEIATSGEGDGSYANGGHDDDH